MTALVSGEGVAFALGSDDERSDIQLRRPWIDRARPQATSHGFLVRTDLSSEATDRLVEAVFQARSDLDELLGAPAPRGLERPHLLFFADPDELDFTMRSECVVPGFRSQGSARTFANDSGQWLLISTEAGNALALHRDLRAAAAQQYLDARFGTRLPPWLHEGLLEYAAAFHQLGSKRIPGEPPSDFVTCLRALDASGDWLAPSQLAALDRDQWPGDQEETSLQMRAQAWAILHFLMHGPPALGTNRIRGLVADAVSDSFQPFEITAPSDSEKALLAAYAAHLRGLEVGPVTRLRELGEQLRATLEEAEALGIRITEVGALQSRCPRPIPHSVELRLKQTRSKESPRALRALKLSDPPMSVLLEQPGAGRVRISWMISSDSNETQARWIPVVDW